MDKGQDVKIVYLDSGTTRVIRGKLISEDDFSFHNVIRKLIFTVLAQINDLS